MFENKPRVTVTAALIGILVGIVGGLIGLAPHLVGGGRLPLQNLWADGGGPGGMPFVLLPVSQYFITTILSMLVIGGVVAGLAVRLMALRRAVPAWAASLGLLLLHAVAIAQSFVVAAGGIRAAESGGTRATLYIAGLLGGTIAVALLAQVGFWLTSRASTGPVALGIALAAVPFGSWGAAFVASVVNLNVGESTLVVGHLSRWLPVIVVGLALGWCGILPLRRLAVWAVGLLALWVLPGLLTAVQYALGSRAMYNDVPGMISSAQNVFVMTLTMNVWPIVVALVLAVIVALVAAAVRRSRAEPSARP